MKRLSKEQIQFIDNYLVKNKVKYWDVRFELLDHIVSAVEERMDNGLPFNDALLNVHESFGNKLGNYKSPTFEDKLYYSNLGFKKFTITKQKEINRKSRREYWVSFISFLQSKKFILEYCALLALVTVLYRYNQKLAFIILFVITLLPELVKFYYMLIEKATRSSLNMQLKMVFNCLSLSLKYYFVLAFNLFYKEELLKPYLYLIVLYLLIFPFLRHDINVFKSTLKIYKSHYKQMFS